MSEDLNLIWQIENKSDMRLKQLEQLDLNIIQCGYVPNTDSDWKSELLSEQL